MVPNKCFQNVCPSLLSAVTKKDLAVTKILFDKGPSTYNKFRKCFHDWCGRIFEIAWCRNMFWKFDALRLRFKLGISMCELWWLLHYVVITRNGLLHVAGLESTRIRWICKSGYVFLRIGSSLPTALYWGFISLDPFERSDDGHYRIIHLVNTLNYF